LLQRLDDERVLTDALGDWRQLAGLGQRRQLRRFLEALRRLRGIRDDFRAFELADQRGLARGLRERADSNRADEDTTDDDRGEWGSKRRPPVRPVSRHRGLPC